MPNPFIVLCRVDVYLFTTIVASLATFQLNEIVAVEVLALNFTDAFLPLTVALAGFAVIPLSSIVIFFDAFAPA